MMPSTDPRLYVAKKKDKKDKKKRKKKKKKEKKSNKRIRLYAGSGRAGVPKNWTMSPSCTEDKKSQLSLQLSLQCPTFNVQRLTSNVPRRDSGSDKTGEMFAYHQSTCRTGGSATREHSGGCTACGRRADIYVTIFYRRTDVHNHA